MIQDISSYEDCREFISGFQGDPLFSDPMLSTQEMLDCNLIKAFTRPNRRILGVYDEQLAGLFVLLTLPEEKYLEMLVGLSREKQVYAELLTFLKQEYSGWNGDFVFNPRNVILKETLQDENAAFEQEQQRMVFSGQLLPVNTDEIHAFSEQYFAEYCVIHGKDMYWTGEKIAAAPEKFRTFLAINQGHVIGYLDVTHCFEENEPYDIYVLPEYRRKGYGRKLLAKALDCNQPRGMMLLVETDNTAAIRLYESMNFKTVPGQNSLTAHWQIPEEKEIDFDKYPSEGGIRMYFEELCSTLQALQPIEALVLGGSRAGERYDQKSDYDLYVYCTELPSPEIRMELLRRVCDRIELGNDFWELEDDCVLKDGIPVDILYRSLDAFAQDVAAVVEGYSARNGYTTCMWHNLLHSRVLYDRDGRYAALQRRFDVPYPEQLRQNILRRNLRLITGNLPSYDAQLRKAVSREDKPSINHRMTHPGEKRMLTILKSQAAILPNNFEETLNDAFTNMFTNPDRFLNAMDGMVQSLVEVVEKELL